MLVSSICPECIFFPSAKNVKEQIEGLAQKVQAIWNFIYDIVTVPIFKIIHVVRSAIGAVVRDAFFFPLKSILASRQAIQDQLKIEEAYYRDFWDPSKPLDPSLKNHEKIREQFSPPEDHVIPIQLKDGRTVEITCRVVQTKHTSEKFYNFAQVPGIGTTISNNIATTYPYLSSYIDGEDREDGNPLSPARFILISENNLNYKPSSLDEAGFILLEILKALREQFGDINQVVAHSLGAILLANALKQADDSAIVPEHICFDRGPTSIWEISKNYLFGLGQFLIYPLAQCGKWSSDIEEDIVILCKKCKKRFSLLFTGVVKDFYFPDRGNLCFGEKIKKIKGVKVLVFNPPDQLYHGRAHHNLRPDLLNARYLIGESDFITPTENLSDAIIRNSRTAAEGLQQIA